MKVGYNVYCVGGCAYMRRRCAWVVTVVVVPVGNMNVLVDWTLECMNGSGRVPAVEVAPVSLTADGMEPLMIPCLMIGGDMWVVLLCLSRQCLLFVLRCCGGRVKCTWNMLCEGVASRVQ